jgi:hypothetical protein
MLGVPLPYLDGRNPPSTPPLSHLTYCLLTTPDFVKLKTS